MWPQHFSTGTTITIFEYTNAQCTGSSRKFSQAIGSCISVDAKYRMKIIAATSENTPVSTPVSTPTTAVVPSPVSSPISGALTGYGFFATYLDDSCTTFASATILTELTRSYRSHPPHTARRNTATTHVVCCQ
jgi:hypothetical protein